MSFALVTMIHLLPSIVQILVLMIGVIKRIVAPVPSSWGNVRPMTIWRSPDAPPITPECTKFLRKRIYGHNVPANCPPFQRIAVFDDNFMGPAFCKPCPQYSNADATTLLKEMFGDAGTCHPRRHGW